MEEQLPFVSLHPCQIMLQITANTWIQALGPLSFANGGEIYRKGGFVAVQANGGVTTMTLTFSVTVYDVQILFGEHNVVDGVDSSAACLSQVCTVNTACAASAGGENLVIQSGVSFGGTATIDPSYTRSEPAGSSGANHFQGYLRLYAGEQATATNNMVDLAVMMMVSLKVTGLCIPLQVVSEPVTSETFVASSATVSSPSINSGLYVQNNANFLGSIEIGPLSNITVGVDATISAFITFHQGAPPFKVGKKLTISPGSVVTLVLNAVSSGFYTIDFARFEQSFGNFSTRNTLVQVADSSCVASEPVESPLGGVLSFNVHVDCNESAGLSTEAIIGIAVGGACALGILIVAIVGIVYFKRKRIKRLAATQEALKGNQFAQD